ncbi:hypothetical protein HR45_15580 [Shewanella mangrovi]|uniref:DUF2947 domain-containing protein n=1 Tax=Shewanella mangrovi TaxID=1515746 RepID=A0A094LN44_9GAMM|nr:DUF2947 domain-containing protein [Shewanella mangrovi]KFZ36553.1 hypothetical protein HR45_15580 [Shewanella mangrovi]
MSLTYQPLEQYRRRWMFNHHELPVSEADALQIKPLTQKSAMDLWNRLVSNKSVSPEEFAKGDWPTRTSTWHQSDEWQAAWDSDDQALPELIAQFIEWPEDAKVFFCYEKYDVIETTWGCFKRNWKCFLFNDNEPLFISSQHRQAVWFHQDGSCDIGLRG